MKALLVSLLLVCLIHSSAALRDESDCQNVTVSGATGGFSVTTNASVDCYQFMVSNVTGPLVYPTLHPGDLQKQAGGLDSIIVYTLSDGVMVEVSNRSYNKTGNHDPYLVIANVTTKQTTAEVMRVVLNIRPKDNITITAGSYDDSTCLLTYNSAMPAALSPPDYLAGQNLTATCQYEFSLEPASDVMYSALFTKFNTREPSSISYESPTEGTVLDKFSGSELPPDLLIENGTKLTMSIDMNVQSMNFTAQQAHSSAQCSGYKQIGDSSVTLASPGYPTKPYPNNLDCKYIIYANDSSKFLRLNPTTVQLSAGYDSISLIDGGAFGNVETKLIAYLSHMDRQSQTDNVYLSSGPTVMFRFKSDALGNAPGFSFNISTEAESRLFFAPAELSFAPNGTEPNSAVFTFLAPRDSIIEFAPDTEGAGIKMSPDSTVMCYDGDSSASGLIASYRTDLLIYPTYTTQNRLLCTANNFNAGNDVFNASIKLLQKSFDKFSFASSDSFAAQIPIVSSENQTVNWIIQPDGFNDTVIEVMVNELTIPAKNTTVDLYNLKGIHLANIAENTQLPFTIRLNSKSGLRFAISSMAVNSSSPLTTMIVSASYTLDNIQANLTDKSGSFMSPRYPLRTPQDTKKQWMITVPANKSLHLTFDTTFELSSMSYIQVMKYNNTFLNITGPLMAAPADIVLNNTSVNKSMPITVSLVTYNQSTLTGVKMYYQILDGGFNTSVMMAGLDVRTPGYPSKLNDSYTATWVFSVDKNDSKGILQQVNAQITFAPNNSTKLMFRDGVSSAAPVLNHTVSRTSLLEDKYTVISNSNHLYMSYTYTKGPKVGNKTVERGNPFNAMIKPKECASGAQCMLQTNETVCIPSTWRCDNKYQCVDGKDELNCNTPSTKAPAVTKEGAKWWVVALCILAGFVLGIIITTIIISCIMRRRGAGYNRLSELMTPVPT